VEIFTRVLVKYLVPRDRIEQFIAEVRSDSYQSFAAFGRKDFIFRISSLLSPTLKSTWCG